MPYFRSWYMVLSLSHSPLWQLVLAGPRRPREEAHLPGGRLVGARVDALLLVHEGVEVAAAPAVRELLAALRLLVVAPPLEEEGKVVLTG